MGLGKGFFILGLLTGAVSSSLLAPQTGEELREKIKRERKAGGNGMNSMKDQFSEMGNEVVVLAQEYSETPQAQAQLAKGKKYAMMLAQDAGKYAKTYAKPMKKNLESRARDLHKDASKRLAKAMNDVKKKIS